MVKLPAPLSFDWDEGNVDKNWEKHRIHFKEAEEVFFNRPLKIYSDFKHSGRERRFLAYGITDRRKGLTIVFTLRDRKIRIMSARYQSKKERRTYDKK